MKKLGKSNVSVSAKEHLEPDAFDLVIRKTFSVEDTIIAEYDVKGSILSKGTLYVCKDRLLCKKPKVSLEYKQIQSLVCVKKKISIKLDDSKTEYELKCKSMEHATSVFNLIKELYQVQLSKPLEKVTLDEKNKKYLDEKMPKLEESATPTEEKQSSGTASGGIVSQMLGKSIVEFNLMVAENQDYFDCKVALQKQTIQYSTHELKFSEITEYKILSTPYHIQINFNNPKIKSITLFVREYISFTQTLKKKYPNLEISFSPNCRNSKIKGGWCNDVNVLASTENSGAPPIMGLKPPGGMFGGPHKKVLSMASPISDSDKNIDDIGKNQPGVFVNSSNKLPIDNSEDSGSKAHLRSRSVFTKPAGGGTFTPPASYKIPENTPTKRKSDDQLGSSTPLILSPPNSDVNTTPQPISATSSSATPTIILSSPKTPESSITPPVIITGNSTSTATATTPNTTQENTSSENATTEEGKVVVHLNLGRAKQARQRKPTTIHRPQLSKIDEATKERTIEIGAEAGSNAQLDREVDLNAATKKRASIKTPKSPIEEGMDTV